MCVHGEGDGGAGGEHEEEEDDDEPGAPTVGANQRLVEWRHLGTKQHWTRSRSETRTRQLKQNDHNGSQREPSLLCNFCVEFTFL